MPQVSIGLSRVTIWWDVGWPIKPSGAKRNGWKRGHPFDYESELKAWPRWRRGFHFVRLNPDIDGAAPAWGLWVYSWRGARSVNLAWRPRLFTFRAHLHLPRAVQNNP